MAEIRDYDVTAANNNSSPPDGAPEGQLPSTINDTIREVMARLKREWSDRSGVNTTAGTSNAYTLAASQTITAYAAGDVFMFIADRANTGAATLAVDGLAAKSLVSNAQTALVANQIVANGIYVAAYDATNDTFQVMGVTDTGGALTLTSLSTDTINEKTAAAGVTVDGVLLKDGGAVFADGATIEVDTVNEATAAAGVTVDGVLLKDGGVTATSASSITAASGTALRVTNTGSGDSLLIEDSANPDSTPFVINSAGSVGVGTTSPDGNVHIHNGTAGSVSANTGADELVVENNGSCGISLLAPDAQNTNVYFGAVTDNVGAFLRWNHDAGLFKVSTDLAGAEMAFSTAGDTERMRIDSAGNVGIGVSSPVRLLHLQQTDNPIIRLNETATSTSYTELMHLTSNFSRLQHTAATGEPALDLDAYASDGASNQYIRAFRNSNASAAAIFALYQPGTVDIQHYLSSSDAYVVAQTGDFGVGTSSPTEKLDINGDAIRVRTSQTPASASAAGDAGQICWDANYIYVCTATNTWKRSALATW